MFKNLQTALLLFIFFVGCSYPKLEGPNFKPLTDLPEDKALIYIYWVDEYDPYGNNLQTQYTLEANGIVVGTIKNGGYIPYFFNGTEVELTAFGSSGFFSLSSYNFSVENGKVYYIACTTLISDKMGGAMYLNQLQMEIVSKIRGSAEIQGCKLISH